MVKNEILIGLVVGCILSSLYFYNRTESPTATPEIISKFKALSENEARHFADAKTAEEKLKAADALYEKMMLIFLADLALKMQPIHKIDPVMVDQTVKEIRVPESDVNDKEPIEKPLLSVDVPEPLIATKIPPAPSTINEYKNASPIRKLDPTSRKILGKFEGSLKHTAGKNKGRMDTIQIALDIAETNGKLDGSARIMLTDPDGFDYSTKRGEGGSGGIKLHPTKKSWVFLEVSPSSFFLIDTDQLNGEYFDNEQRVGVIQLRRL